MKVSFQDSDNYASFEIKPEDMKELAALFRLVKNARKQKPDMYLSFSQYNDQPYLSLSFQKVNVSNQVTSISK